MIKLSISILRKIYRGLKKFAKVLKRDIWDFSIVFQRLFSAQLFPKSHKKRMNLQKSSYNWPLACVMLFKNEAPYLKEWIEYHLCLGVEHFYLYNHESTDHYNEILKPYIDDGVVELIDWFGTPKNHEEWLIIQTGAYNDAICRARGNAKWLAVIDADEFIVPAAFNDVVTFLELIDSPNLGGIYVWWIFFGTSFLKDLPGNQLMIESLIWNENCKGRERKTILKPESVERMDHAHYPIFRKGYNVLHLPFRIMQLNHYWSRDETHLLKEKIPRTAYKRHRYPIDLCLQRGLEIFNRKKEPYCLPIQRFVPQLRKKMGFVNE